MENLKNIKNIEKYKKEHEKDVKLSWICVRIDFNCHIGEVNRRQRFMKQVSRPCTFIYTLTHEIYIIHQSFSSFSINIIFFIPFCPYSSAAFLFLYMSNSEFSGISDILENVSYALEQKNLRHTE